MYFEKIGNELGVGECLDKAHSARIVNELNGEYNLVFKSEKLLKLWGMIKTHTLEGLDFFYINNIKSEGGVYEYTCPHVSYLLENVFIDKINEQNRTLKELSHVLNEEAQRELTYPFNFSSEIQRAKPFKAEFTTLYNLIFKDDEALTKKWHTQVIRRGFNIEFRPSQGNQTEILLAKRKNLTSYSQNSTIKDVATVLKLRKELPQETNEGNEATTEKKYIEATVTSPLKSKYPHPLIKVIEVNDEDITTVEHLKKYGENLFSSGLDKPSENIKITANIEPNFEKLNLGDSVLIYYEEEDVYNRIELTAYEFDPIAKKLTSVNFGKLPLTLSRVLNKREEKIKRPLQTQLKATHNLTMANHQGLGTAKLERKTINTNMKQGFGKIGQQIQEQDKVFRQEIKKTVDGLNATKRELRTLIQQTAEEIKLEASRRYASQSEVSRLSVKADEIKSEVSSVRRDVNQVESNISSLELRADRITSAVRHMADEMNGMETRINQKADGIAFETLRYKFGVVERVTQMTIGPNGVRIGFLTVGTVSADSGSFRNLKYANLSRKENVPGY